MTTIDINRTPPSLDDLLKLTQAGDEVLLTRDGQPIARVTPAQPPMGASQLQPRNLELFPGGVWMSDDFNDPLPDDFWLSGYP
jgi:antitoxin (DNA-binding transcriptional repressor) of toxin-antitoxin stability system